MGKSAWDDFPVYSDAADPWAEFPAADAAPAKPKRQVGIAEAGGRGVLQGYGSTGATLATAAGAIPLAMDKLAGLFSDKPVTAATDAYFGNPVTQAFMEAPGRHAIDPNAEELTTAGTVANVGGNLASTVQQMAAMPGAVSGATVPLLRAAVAARAPAEAAKIAASQLPAVAVKGAPLIVPQAVQTERDVLEAGGDVPTALRAGATSAATNTAMVALPLSMAGGALKRAATGAAVGVPSGIAQRAAVNEAIGDDPQLAKLQQPAFGGEQMATDMALNTAMALMFGPRAGGARRPAPAANPAADEAARAEAVQLAADFERWRPILEAQGVTTPEEAASKIAALRAREQRVQEQQSAGIPGDKPQRTAVVDEVLAGDRDPGTLPTAGAPQRSPIATMYVDAAGRALPDSMDGTRAGVMAAEGTQAREDVRRRQAFDEVEARRRRADADLSQTNQIGQDYQGGLSAAPGGEFDSGIRRVTLLDARQKGGRLAGGESVEILGTNDETGDVRVLLGNGVEIEVKPERLSEHDIPANQRQAQDFQTRSSEPPRGVGEDTMAGEKMPRRSTDRISGDEVGGIYSRVRPGDVDGGGPHEGEVLPADRGQLQQRGTEGVPDVPRGYRMGGTLEGQAREVVDGLPLEDRSAQPRLPSPDDQAPGGAKTGRLRVDEQGNVTPERETYGERQARGADEPRAQRVGTTDTAREPGRGGKQETDQQAKQRLADSEAQLKKLERTLQRQDIKPETRQKSAQQAANLRESIRQLKERLGIPDPIEPDPNGPRRLPESIRDPNEAPFGIPENDRRASQQGPKAELNPTPEPEAAPVADSGRIVKEADGETDAVHYGDLGIGRDTTRQRMTLGRGTGHYGTGVYFLSRKASAGSRSGRPPKFVNTDGLNLYKAANDISAKLLHDALRLVNDLARNGDPLDFDSITAMARKAVSQLATEIGFKREAEVREAIKAEVEAERAGLPDGEKRSASTRVMQRLGYDGVDVRGTRYDNGDYGSVIYPPRPRPQEQKPAPKDPRQVGDLSSRPGSAAQLLNLIRKAGGISTFEVRDIVGERGFRANSQYPGLFRRAENAGRFGPKPMEADGLAELLWQEGYMTEGEYRDNGPELARQMVRDAMDGKPILQLLGGERAEAQYLRDRGISMYDANRVGPDGRYTREEAESIDFLEREVERQLEGDALDDIRERAAIESEGLSDEAYQQELKGRLQDALGIERTESPAVETPAGEQGPGAGRSGAEDSRQADEGPAPWDDEPPAGERRPDFDLNQPTPDELRAREAEAQRRAEEERKAEEKAKADAERPGFVLAGSDRAVDQAEARGQSSLLDEASDLSAKANSGTLYSNPVGPVVEWLGKHLGFDDGHLGRAVEDAKAMFSRDKAPGVNPVAHFVRTVGFSLDGQFRALEKVFGDSKAIAEVRRLFNADPGQGTGVGRTYGEAVSHKSIEFRNRMFDAMDAWLDKFGDGGDTAAGKKAAREQLARKLQNRGAIGKGELNDAARSLAKLLDDVVDYAREAGVKIEKVRDYFPRVIDADAVLKDPAGFRAAAERAYRRAGLGASEAKAAAEAYTRSITLGASNVRENPFTDFNNSVPNQNFTKHRELTRAADELLAPYLLKDPVDVLETYIHKVVRRAEWERRLGGEVEYKDASGRKVKGTRYDRMRDAMVQEGNLGAIELVDDLVGAATGELPMNNNRFGRGLRTVASWGRSLSVIQFLRHATLTSLSEPILTGVRTGNIVGDTYRGYAYSLSDLARRSSSWLFGKDSSIAKALTSGDTETARRAAEMIGLIENHLAASAAHVLQADGMHESSKLASKLASRATVLSGLRQWTDATRVASTRVGMRFIAHLAEDAAKGDKLAQRSLRELGVPQDQQAAFSAWLTGQKDVAGALATDAGHAATYRTALGRFVDQVIMNPKSADKPYWASHPVGSVAYNLTGYLYAFQQNVLNRAGRMIRDAAKNPDGLGATDRLRLLAPVLGLTMLPLAQAALVPVRDMLKGTDEEKRKKKYTETAKTPQLPFVGEVDTGIPAWMTEALSRSGVFGAADPFINLAISAKYEKRPSSMLVGAVGQGYEQLFSDIFGRNSPNTNTQERTVMKDLYSTLVDPAVTTFATAYMPGPAAAAVSQGMAMERTREAFVTATAGEKKKKKSTSNGTGW